MKKIFTTLFYVALLNTLHAQNVGIGTATPAAKLDVKTTNSYVSQFNGAAPMYMGIFENDIYRGYWGSYSGAAQDVDFGTGSGNTLGKLHLTMQAIPKLTIDATGNVGIGTTSPLTNLHVTGSSSTLIRSEATGTAEAGLELLTNGGIYDFLEVRKWPTLSGGSVAGIPLAGLSTITTGTMTTGGLLIGTKTANPTYFTTGNVERMRLTATGDLGIGVTAPVAKVEIGNLGIEDALKVTHRPGTINSVTTLKNDGTLYHEGQLWVHSYYGQIRYGYADKGWTLGTINGGQDLQFWSYNPNFATQTIRMYIDGINGNLGLGTGNTPANYRLEVEAGTQTGIHARSTVNKTDSAAIMAVLDVPTGADFRVAAVRGESKSTTSNSIGVYGLQNGGGWGVAGSVKEAGLSGWGAGVYGEAGLKGVSTGTGGYGVYGANNNSGGTAGYFINYALDVNSKALKTEGKIQLTGISEGTGKVLTSDASGNATWTTPTVVAHNHFGETWSGDNATSGLNINNTNTASGTASAFIGRMSGGGSATNRGIEGSSNSTGGLGVFGTNLSTGGNTAAALGNTGVAGVAGSGIGVFGASISGPSIYGRKSGSATNSVAKFENLATANTDPTVLITSSATVPTALELNNGYIKVSGTNKMAFTVTATAGNSSGHILTLSYPNQDPSDILLVTHNYNPPGGSANYLTSPYSVYYSGNWNIYLDDFAAILGKSFNVIVIKQ